MTEDQEPPKLNLKKILKKVLKIWVVFTSIIGTLAIVSSATLILLISSLSSSTTNLDEKVVSGKGKDKIAVIKIEGMISEEAAPFDPLSSSTGIVSARQIRHLLNQAKEDPNVKAVILRVNSPGGSAVGSDVIYELIEDFKNQTQKKVVVSMGDIAASGGYYLASAADKIVANPSTITGSIGVIASLYNLSGLYDKIGVKHEVYKTGQFKDLFSESRERTPEEKALIQSLLDDSINRFINQVAKGRGVEEEKVKSVADGRILSGHQAKQVGLVDELGNLDKAIEVSKALANLKEATIVEYSSGSFLENILGSTIRNLNLLNLFSSIVKPTGGFSLLYLLEI